MDKIRKIYDKILRFFGLRKETPVSPGNSGDDVLRLMTRDDRIRKQYRENAEKTDKPAPKKCPICGEETDELLICSGCGQKGCSGCFTYNPEDHKYYCPKCW